MDNEIKELLIKFNSNPETIKLLRASFDIYDIVRVALDCKMYDTIIALFKPIEIDNEFTIYFDAVSFFSCYTILDEYDIPEDELNKIKESFYDIDMNIIKKIKIGNTQARAISGWNHPVRNVNDVIFYAEPACLETMLYFFNNNMRTIQNDTECVYGENKEIADALVQEGIAHFVKREVKPTISIEVPVNKNDTVEEVSKRLLSIAKRFSMQDILYGVKNYDEMVYEITSLIQKVPAYKEFIPDFDISTILDFKHACYEMTVYDEESQMFYDCPEYLNMHQKYLATLNKNNSRSK